MKLILQKDVKNLGKTGDQVSVKKGFARNYLIPKGYAVLMNKNRLKAWEHQKVIIEAKKRQAVSERKTLIEKLSSIKLKFEKEAQKDNRLFGSVTAHEISQALEKLHQLNVDKRDIHFTELKTVGEHSVAIKLDSENQTEIKLSIKGKVRKADYENKTEEPLKSKAQQPATDSKENEPPKDLEASTSESSALDKEKSPKKETTKQTESTKQAESTDSLETDPSKNLSDDNLPENNLKTDSTKSFQTEATQISGTTESQSPSESISPKKESEKKPEIKSDNSVEKQEEKEAETQAKAEEVQKKTEKKTSESTKHSKPENSKEETEKFGFFKNIFGKK